MMNKLFIAALLFLTLSAFQIRTCLAQKTHILTITGSFEGIIPKDNIACYVWKDLISTGTQYLEPHQKVTAKIIDGKFSIKVNLADTIGYLLLGQGTHNGSPVPILNLYRFQGLDSVNVNIIAKPDTRSSARFTDSGDAKYQYQLKFGGAGAEKYAIQYEMETGALKYNNEYHLRSEHKYPGSGLVDQLKYELEYQEFLVEKQRADLKKAHQLIPTDFSIKLETDLICLALGNVYRSMEVSNLSRCKTMEKDSVHQMLARANLVKMFKSIQVRAKSMGYRYLSTSVTSTRIEQITSKTPVSVFELLCKNHHGTIRDQLLVWYINAQSAFFLPEEFSAILKKAMSVVSEPTCVQLLKHLQQQASGTAMFPFELPDQTGKLVKLNDFKGKLLFIDFFYTGCGNCISYFTQIVSGAEAHFKNNPNIAFITISIDADRKNWLASVKSGQYTSADVHNLYTGGLGASHPLIKALNIRGYPHPMLISRAGKIISNSYVELGQNDLPRLISAINKALVN